VSAWRSCTRPASAPASRVLAHAAGDLLHVVHPGRIHVSREVDLLQAVDPRLAIERDVALVIIGGAVIGLGQLGGEPSTSVVT
jgi:hypothetical protein